MPNYTVVIPVLNQLNYTRTCIESLVATGTPRERILVINNASSDDTAAWLAEGAWWHVNNPVNLGCGGGWTQGALLAGNADWVILLNNDVVLCDAFCERLLAAAERLGLDVVSPAMVENDLDYDFAAWSQTMVHDMADVVRAGRAHGVCFAVRASVFHAVGFPDTDRRLGGHEDQEFFIRCQAAGKTLGTVGAAFLHHYGSITQKAMKSASGQKSLGQRHVFYARAGMSWLQRKLWKRSNRQAVAQFSAAELARHGKTLHAIREHGNWTWI